MWIYHGMRQMLMYSIVQYAKVCGRKEEGQMEREMWRILLDVRFGWGEGMALAVDMSMNEK